MNNYQHHDKAQQLADTHSAYELARRVVELESARSEPVATVDRWNQGGSGEFTTATGIERLPHGTKLYTAPPAPASVPEQLNAYEILGWCHAFFCVSLDEGEDPREIEIGGIVEKMKKQLLSAPQPRACESGGSVELGARDDQCPLVDP